MSAGSDTGAAVAMRVTLEAVARAAYAAYGETTGHKNFRGDPMPDWADLGDTIQRAWRNATVVGYSVGYRDRELGLDSLTLVD